jgi:hypothetical protein
MRQIVTAGNTLVPALLALEALGFRVDFNLAGDDGCRAMRGDEAYVGDDPVSVLGLVKLVEARGWDWPASEAEVDATLLRYSLGGGS